MATITNYGKNTTTGRRTDPIPLDPSCQPCPDCGGLECLCRPRFFAGQLLSEQDLNRLDHYITEKHKLHNRHLFGSGVVCGLEVTCAPCDSGFVNVSPGYALSPCGEDIVVCKQDMVNICALIARCRTDTEPDCSPYRGQDNCGDVIEDWILSLRYAESPSRGITPLTGAGQGCGCSCAGPCTGKCGGPASRGGGCSCGGGPSCSCGSAVGIAQGPSLAQPRLNRGAPPSCEPTVTCETYRYDVFRAPLAEPSQPQGEQTGIAGVFAQLEGDMMANIACCIKQLEASLPAAPGDVTAITAAQVNAWFQWGCQMRTALANYFVRTGGTDCEALAKLQAIVIPSPAQPLAAFQAAMEQAVLQFALIYIEAVIACFCSNALPPCPPAEDPRVPLALVKVRKGDCHVVSVCDWTPLRKHVLTFPTLEYWFGFIPIARLLHEAMHKVCCDLFGFRNQFQPRDNALHPAMMAGAVAQPEMARAAATASPLDAAVPLDIFAGMQLDSALFEALAKRIGGAAGGGASFADLAKLVTTRSSVSFDPALSGKDREAALARVAGTAPLGIVAAMFGSAAHAVETVTSPHSADIAELKATVASQSGEIAALRAAMGRAHN